MKTLVLPRMAALLTLGMITPLIAQSTVSTPRSFHMNQKSDDSAGKLHPEAIIILPCSGSSKASAPKKAQGNLLDSKPAYHLQSGASLKSVAPKRQISGTVIDLSSLRSLSQSRKVAGKTSSLPRYEIEENSLQKGLLRMSEAYLKSIR